MTYSQFCIVQGNSSYTFPLDEVIDVLSCYRSSFYDGLFFPSFQDEYYTLGFYVYESRLYRVISFSPLILDFSTFSLVVHRRYFPDGLLIFASHVSMK